MNLLIILSILSDDNITMYKNGFIKHFGTFELWKACLALMVAEL